MKVVYGRIAEAFISRILHDQNHLFVRLLSPVAQCPFFPFRPLGPMGGDRFYARTARRMIRIAVPTIIELNGLYIDGGYRHSSDGFGASFRGFSSFLPTGFGCRLFRGRFADMERVHASQLFINSLLFFSDLFEIVLYFFLQNMKFFQSESQAFVQIFDGRTIAHQGKVFDTKFALQSQNFVLQDRYVRPLFKFEVG